MTFHSLFGTGQLPTMLFIVGFYAITGAIAQFQRSAVATAVWGMSLIITLMSFVVGIDSALASGSMALVVIAIVIVSIAISVWGSAT